MAKADQAAKFVDGDGEGGRSDHDELPPGRRGSEPQRRHGIGHCDVVDPRIGEDRLGPTEKEARRRRATRSSCSARAGPSQGHAALPAPAINKY
jgi:hypothetical protein